ncbi:MAG: citrate synthase, partial [Armatimonadetes bacterium]|nr:citrate synthase [Armatimonadota bacterium]
MRSWTIRLQGMEDRMADYSPGLEGVIAGETAICTINESGLSYRGYSIQDLAEKCTFEEVAYLLLHGELPGRSARAEFARTLARQRALPADLTRWVRRIPAGVHPMDALRTAISLQSHHDPDRDASSREANLRKAVRLLAQTPALIAEWHCARRGRPAPKIRQSGSHAAHLLRLLAENGEELAGDPAAVRAVDVSLILYAEHEFNASTFGARVVVSTLSD